MACDGTSCGRWAERRDGTLAPRMGLGPFWAGHDKSCAKTCFDCGIAQGTACPPENVRHLQGPPLGDRLPKSRLPGCNVELAECRHDFIVEPGSLAKFEPARFLAVIEIASVGCGELNRTLDNSPAVRGLCRPQGSLLRCMLGALCTRKAGAPRPRVGPCSPT